MHKENTVTAGLLPHRFGRPARSRHARAAAIARAGFGLAAILLAGCGGSTSTPDATPDAPGRTTALQMPSVSLAPGQETTMCVVVPLGNATAQMLRRVHSVITSGSHHLIAYRVPPSTPPQLTPTPCESFADAAAGISPVIIAESPDSEVAYPDGVGLPVEAQQMVKLEEHFINAGDSTLHSSATVEFTMTDPDPNVVAASLLFWGSQGFEIMPHAAGSADLAHPVPAGVTVFGLTTHEHHFGTLATVELARSASAPGTELYRNADWAHPPLKTFDPPLAFDGTQWLRLHCSWVNTSSKPVHFGPSAATDEMCFFWAYYYPSQGFQVCNEDECQVQ
jgi:copper type II ascorbate-dependent monooxygenase-like protein